jgi:glycosyltransferase involved in cell wall biosynthesis
LRLERPDARLLLVGAVSPGFDHDRRLQRLGQSEEGIVREAYVEEGRLWALMSACDVCVNLRSPTMGETSGSVIRQLSLGKPVVVSDVGWFSELPDDVALKVPVDGHETDALYAALELLARDSSARAAMSAAALELVRREHDLDRTAELYVAALEQALGGDAVTEAVLGDVARAAAEVGIGAGSAEATELARRLAEVELGR